MTREDKRYWVWLSVALGPGIKTGKITSSFKSPREIYESDDDKLKSKKVFTSVQIKKLRSATLEDAGKIIDLCERKGWQIVTLADKEYPAGLRKITDAPFVLYVDGDISCLRGKVIIGVVGTRHPGEDGVTVAHKLCTDMSAAGAVIVSGGALGIDSAAHKSALFANGKTVCVLGCGFGTSYLNQNRELRQKIAQSGALVTEYPPYTPAAPYTFPKRNRIISGMSHAVLVVEAGEKSGSLITAKEAMKQKRTVFVVPGSVLSSAYTGANRLVADGAKVAVDAYDILRPFAQTYPDRLDLEMVGTIEYTEEVDQKEKVAGLDPDMEAVYNCLGSEAVHFDEIVAMTGLAPSKTIIAIMKLELAEYITETESKKYILN